MLGSFFTKRPICINIWTDNLLTNSAISYPVMRFRRSFIIILEPYTYEQFCEIRRQLSNPEVAGGNSGSFHKPVL